MKLQFKSLFFLLLVPALVFANNGKFKGKYTKEKTIKKEYTVNANAKFEVVNSYGNVDVVSWNENRVVIDVVIKTNGNNEEKVQKRLDEITVDFTGSASMVSAKTNFGSTKGKSWSLFGKNNNVSVEVNYTIKVPLTNSVELDNNYGAISLNRIQGQAKIICDYGKIIIGELMGDDNYLNFDYTSKSTIGYMKSGRINADYSGFTLDNVENLELSADYTDSNIGEVENLNFNCDYGSLEVDNAGKVIGQGDYVSTRLGTISRSVELNADYGSIKIERLTSSVKNVTIDSDYTGIKIGFDGGLSFDFYVETSYASMHGGDYLNVMHTNKSGSNKTYEGYHRSKGSGNKIEINTDYGGVTFKKL